METDTQENPEVEQQPIVRCISLWQPWASLMALGIKTVETRHWNTKVRGQIYIHASKTHQGMKYVDALTTEQLNEFERALGWKRWHWQTRLPFGKIIAVGNLINSVPSDKALAAYPEQELWGDFSDGRFGHIYDNLQAIDPIPFSGKQGFFKAPAPN